MTFQTTKIQPPEEGRLDLGRQVRTLRVGTVLWGRYEVAAVLGSGELGELWRCLDRETGGEICLRWLPPDMQRSKPIMAVIHAGIRRISDQTHPNLAAIRQIVRLRKLPVHDRKEMEAILDVYKSALGID